MGSYQFNYQFAIGSIVYLKTDDRQSQRIVSGYKIRPDFGIVYLLSCGINETEHFDFEITTKKEWSG